MCQKIYKYLHFGVIGIFSVSLGCNKQNAFLDAKPSEALVIPSTPQDLELLLHNEAIFNIQTGQALGSLTTDEYNVPYNVWVNRSATERNAYIFSKDIYQGESVPEWTYLYRQIYYANTALDYLPKIKFSINEQERYNHIKGTALFYRGSSFYNLLQTFAMPFDSTNSKTDLGICLRLTSDLNLKSTRSSVTQCYNQILNDLGNSLDLLPNTSLYITEPSKISANALLARIYLALGNYQLAFKYSDACLSQYDTLLDYNTLSNSSYYLTTGTTYYLAEDMFHSLIFNYGLNSYTVGIVDSVLFGLYSDNDLRKTAFFATYKGAIRFKGSYDIKHFGPDYGGLSTDEMYLIRSESNARLGNVQAAMNDLNALLVKRWKTGTFIPYLTSDVDTALSLIITERRKELCFRGLRWSDLRRLNKDTRFATTIVRNLNGQIYTLLPNDPKYAMPIPDAEIQLSGIPQNVR